MDNFERKLRQILNSFGLDSQTGIPDFVLAQVVFEMLETMQKEKMTIPVSASELIAARKKVIATMMAALSDMSLKDR